SFKEFYKKVSLNGNDLGKKVIDAMTTNETLWFRDSTFYKALEEKVIPWLIEKAKTKPVRIWSAACSTGQEPYSIAMLIDSALRKAGPGAPSPTSFQIMASDISPSAIFMAVSGRYSQLAISRGMPTDHLSRYFKKEGMVYSLDEKVRKMVTFKQLNLKESISSLGQFDFICCRYVLIYFTDELKREIYGKFHKAMIPESLLAIGATESIRGCSEDFNNILIEKGVLYHPKGSNGNESFKGF
ncbi:MAG: protein-glutamate O-methyltransferase CheR, partial [Deltaproteobacteria bacterium]|nr:protein-glutamate O-methyltransferase CheR [Deltaproteobacteria bacterium]